MFAAADSDSAPLVPMVRCMSQAIAYTTRCMIPRWYRIAIRLEKKMIVGRIQNANVLSGGEMRPWIGTALPCMSRILCGSTVWNTKVAPASENDRSLSTPRSITLKNSACSVGLRIISPSVICRPTPHSTGRQRMWRRSTDKSHAIATITNSPPSDRTRWATPV